MECRYSKLQKASIAFWILITVLVTFCFVYVVFTSVSTYLTYPVKNELDAFDRAEQKWPMITLCSLRGLDISSANVMNDVILQTNTALKTPELVEWKTKFEKFQSNAEKFVRLYVMENGDDMETRNGVNMIYSLEGLLANFDEEFVKKAAAKDFVIHCSMGGRKCAKVTSHLDRENGMCYTVHLNATKLGLNTKYLELTAFTGSSAGPDILHMVQLGLSSDGEFEKRGIKIIVQDDYNSTPDEYELPIGHKIDMKMKKNMILRLPAPYGNCGEQKMGGKSCQKICFEQVVARHCGCALEYQNVTSRSDYCLKLPDVEDVCDPASITKQCKESVGIWQKKTECRKSSEHIENQMYCNCPSPCADMKYDVTMVPYPLNAVPNKVTAYWESLDDDKKTEIQSTFTDFDLKELTTVIKINLDPMTVQTRQVIGMNIADLLGQIYLYFMIMILVVTNLIYAICSGRRKR